MSVCIKKSIKKSGFIRHTIAVTSGGSSNYGKKIFQKQFDLFAHATIIGLSRTSRDGDDAVSSLTFEVEPTTGVTEPEATRPRGGAENTRNGEACTTR